MLTRLEAHGFKNLLNFAVDLGPFNCIAGANGVGKSNVFDAIRFLSLLADHTLVEAALRLRGTESANVRDLFFTDGIRRFDRFKLAAEMIVDPEVTDDFGRTATATSTFLRYEVAIGYVPPDSKRFLGGLVLEHESLEHIVKGDAAKRLKFKATKAFRDAVVMNKRRGGPFISTESTSNKTEILIGQDGLSFGRPQRIPASGSPKTVVGNANTEATPTILAVRRELQRWRILGLEPSAMREVDRFHSDPHISDNGGHMPATLFRLINHPPDPESSGADVCAQIGGRLSDLVAIDSVRVNRDEARQTLTLEAKESSGVNHPAYALSDGTLRFLALCILEKDPESRGLICMEEPENGIHPDRMGAMIELLRDLAVDTEDKPGSDNIIRQVIIATHAPFMVQLQKEEDLLIARQVTVANPLGQGAVKTIRCRPLEATWRCYGSEKGVGKGGILSYLTTSVGAQITLPYEKPA